MKQILKACVGSHSYGTATPTSDFDYMSVVIPNEHCLFGLKQWGNAGTKEEEYQDHIKGFVEHKLFDFRKFISMCAGMNPNAIPLLWLDPMHYEIVTPEGQLLLKNRELFNSRKAYHTFSGYAHGQLQKMGGVFNDNEEPNKLLKEGHLRFQEWAEKNIQFQRANRDAENNGLISGKEYPYDEGYLNALIALRSHSKEECKRIKDGPITGRMGAKRKELRAKFGYDVKFAFHTIRLMKMCVEFLSHPEEGLKVYRKGIDADFLYSIREGKFSQEDIKTMADDLFAEAKEALKTSPLPEEPDADQINDLCVQIVNMSLDRNPVFTGIGKLPIFDDIHTVIVNGIVHEVWNAYISYEDIMVMAGYPWNAFCTITFDKGPAAKPQGSLTPGEKVKVQYGMVFNAVFTG
jgi:hypothetical protein